MPKHNYNFITYYLRLLESRLISVTLQILFVFEIWLDPNSLGSIPKIRYVYVDYRSNVGCKNMLLPIILPITERAASNGTSDTYLQTINTLVVVTSAIDTFANGMSRGATSLSTSLEGVGYFLTIIVCHQLVNQSKCFWIEDKRCLKCLAVFVQHKKV